MGSPVDIFDDLGVGQSGGSQQQNGTVDIFDDIATPQPVKPDTFGDNTLDVLGELAAASNKTLTEFVDFLGPGTINAMLNILPVGGAFSSQTPEPLPSVKTRLPTFTGLNAKVGGEGGFMEPGTARDVVQGIGANIPVAGGLKTVARPAAAVSSQVADFLGIGQTKLPAIGPKVYTSLADATPTVPPQSGRGAEAAKRRGSLLGQRGDAVAAGYKLDDAGNVVKDPAQRAATWQGWEDGFVAMVHEAPGKAKEKFSQMINIVERGKANFRYKADNRPIDIVGDSIVSRFRIVREANRVAASKLDDAAKSLKGQSVDVSPIVDDFISELDNMGVKYNQNTGAFDFAGSDIEGLAGPQNVIKRLAARMRNTQAPDAFDVHRLKRFIDEQVTYGKSAEGLMGSTERIVKRLRHNLNEMLGQKFDLYGRVNNEYRETIRALDALQRVAGGKMDLLGENAASAVGTLSRRLLSNAASRVPLKDAVKELDRVAGKYASQRGNQIVPYEFVTRRTGIKSTDLDDDIMAQLMFVDELEKLVGTHAVTSLQGDVAKGTRLGVNAARGNFGELVVEGAVATANKLKGVSEDAALASMKELLK